MSKSTPLPAFDHGIDILGDEWEDAEEDEDDNNNQQVANEKI